MVSAVPQAAGPYNTFTDSAVPDAVWIGAQ
jgi:hypothetical protein